MKSKLILVTMLAVMNISNAETIRERLIQAQQETAEQKLALNAQKEALEDALAFRISVLNTIHHCMEAEDSDTKETADQCYNKTYLEIEDSSKMGNWHEETIVMVKEQLEKIKIDLQK